MNAVDQRAEARVSATGSVCPAIDAGARWDEPSTLRGEIYTAAELVAHAAELARAHGEPSNAVASGRLWQRYVAVRRQVREAYAVLTARLRQNQIASPAEEWLLENAHVVEDQIREIREDLPHGYRLELPRLPSGVMRGYPRVYALCLDYLRHTDARLDLTTLVEFVESYQRLRPLTMGEIWAVPIMLRLGLLLTVGTLAASEAQAGNRERADELAELLLSARETPSELAYLLRAAGRDAGAVSGPFLVQLARRLRETDDPSLAPAFDWISSESARLGSTAEELARVQHLKQAADQVSVGNAITSMRAVAALDWNEFFERASGVEALLRKDPFGVYAATDALTRDRYRHAVEMIARRAQGGELWVARVALGLARRGKREAPGDAKRAHVGFYLLDAGRPVLERKVFYRPTATQRIRRWVLAHPGLLYFGMVSVLTLGVTALVAALALPSAGGALPPPLVIAWTLLALLPASEIGVALTQALVTAGLEPRLLPRLNLDLGIPPELRTLCVVPCLIDSREALAALLEDLEVRSLANADQHLHFALLSDFADAETEEHPDDGPLLAAATAGIATLNARFPGVEHRYLLLHRKRRFNPCEGTYMGWERKRGKLEELNRLVRGADDTSFVQVTAPRELLRGVRYVLTLDADTELPRETARKLIATLAHPLNVAEFDPKRQRVVGGYAIVQPRVSAHPLSARKSRYAALASGPAGIDPYTTAVSDVYQDLFAEGSYTGKALYDVDAFAAALAGRAPENLLLSHDLFESFFARSALATDVELLDEQPARYEIHAAREHRWIRGDWQLVRWLFPRVPGRGAARPNDLRLLDAWKLLDNLRRSLLPPALVALLAAGWSSGRHFSAIASALVAGVLTAPLVAGAVLALTRQASRTWQPFSGFGGALARGALKVAHDVTFMLDQALVALDAIFVATYRQLSKKKLLEWTTMRQSASGRTGGLPFRMVAGSMVASGACAHFVADGSEALPWALPVLIAWVLSPFVARVLGKPLVERSPHQLLSPDDAVTFRLVARKTWRFFDHFVTAQDNHLPPDNYQAEPRGVIAHRTSPTNIGLYLLSVLSAHHFGVLTITDVARRIGLTLDTLDRLPRREGHILNWYDTETLAPLAPEYVSTVDSGNLAAYLFTIAGSGDALRHAPFPGVEPLLAIADALELADQSAEHGGPSGAGASIRRLSQALRASGERPSSLAAAVDAFAQARRDVQALRRSAATASSEVRYWLAEAELTASTWHDHLLRLAPYLPLLAETAPLVDQTASDVWERLRSMLSEPTTIDEIMTASRRALDLLEDITEASNHTSSHTPNETHAATEFRRAITRGLAACEATIGAFDRVANRCKALADGMSFRFLFDEARGLLSTGYNASNARLDTSYYDLLASEARLASLIAIAKGDVPQKHWFRLARPRARVDSYRALLSWSGSMFEYLMPLLVTQSAPRTLLDEAVRGAVRRQRAHGARHRVPWGISESAYNVMDLELTYQYRAFGVPGLGLRAGLAEDLVVSPYSTALAALVDPVAAVRNLRALAREGLDGLFGYYEAIDYSPSRLPPGKRGVIVRSYMAHHLGMTLVALDNVIHDRKIQRLFHTDPRIKASELLLEERIPTGVELLEVPEAALAAPVRHAPDYDLSERLPLEEGAPPRVHLLGHGSLSTLVTSTGAGSLTWKGIDINRFRQDSAFDGGGIYAYVRNLSDYRIWSATHYPARGKAKSYEAAFFIDRVEFRRRDGAVETITEIVPSAEHAAEVRRFTLKNHGDEPCEVEVTTFTELSLAAHRSDAAHQAFSSLFVETEALPDQGAVIAHRRPRTAGETAIWVAQVLTPEDDGFSAVDFETSRAEFLGQNGTLERPRALAKLESRLSRRTGAVLDAAFVLRRRVRLERGASARVTLTTLMADTRDELLRLVAIYSAAQAIPRTFELGLADARVELSHLGVTAAQAHRFQRLLSAVVFPAAGLRAAFGAGTLGTNGQNALHAQGVSGDLPIVALDVDHPDFGELLRELLLAQEYFRVNGVLLDLVVLHEEPSVYLQPLYEHAIDIVRAAQAEGRLDQPGGIFLRRASQIEEAEKRLLFAAARVVLVASQGSLARQLRRAVRVRDLPPALTFTPRQTPGSLPPPPRERLLFDNGLGGFTPDGREYVMTIGRETGTPAPWCNVIANASFGTLVSACGSGFTWSRNSQRRRLTPWSNDALLDPSGEVVYVRDDDDGSIWTATPRPTGGTATYRVVHGQGYSRFSHTRTALAHELTVFVSAQDPLRFQRLRIENRGTRPRRLSVYGAVEWVLGEIRERSRLSVMTAWDPDARLLTATNPLATLGGTAFYYTTGAVRSVTGNREEFFGVPGSRRFPLALRREALSGHAGSGLDPCAALQTSVSLAPGQTFEASFVLGDAESSEHARALALAYETNAAVDQAFEQARDHWDQLLSAVTVKTPDPALDVLMNRWLLYQALGCRIWARSGFYQSSGAYGFRDQLQDALSLLHAEPGVAREHLLRSARRQFVEGDVQHWWHPEAGDGVRTRCSDDKLWLPYAVAEYVRVTGDRSVLDVPLPFLVERALTPGEDDVYSTPGSTAEGAPLYDHCVRAIESSLAVGARGLPMMGTGDWNDGMNRIGAEGTGESVFVAWFLVKVLRDFSPIALSRRDTARAAHWVEHARRVTEAAEREAWDGAWYRRAFFDDGTAVGSREATECRIDAIAQSWAVLAGTADRRRAARGVLESERLLFDADKQLMLLLTPPFTAGGRDPGYIASYPAGIRENGGQYTHGALFTLRALATLGENERAARLLDALNPIRHTLTADQVERYKVEPYVIAADVYSASEHLGRGGWTWYTGSAGWFYRVVLEDILGFRREGDVATVRPCMPPSWPSFELTVRFGRSGLRIVVTNVEGLPAGERPSHPVSGTTTVPLIDDGRIREVQLYVGECRLREFAPPESDGGSPTPPSDPVDEASWESFPASDPPAISPR